MYGMPIKLSFYLVTLIFVDVGVCFALKIIYFGLAWLNIEED